MPLKEVRRLMLDMYHLYPPATIAKMTGRAIGTIRVMASAMGLRSGGRGRGHDPIYEDSEVEFIRANYGRMSVKEISRHIGRTPRSVTQKARRLGLSPQRFRRWTEAEESIIREHYSDHGARYVATKLDRTIDAIKSRAAKLGVRRDNCGRDCR